MGSIIAREAPWFPVINPKNNDVKKNIANMFKILLLLSNMFRNIINKLSILNMSSFIIKIAITVKIVFQLIDFIRVSRNFFLLLRKYTIATLSKSVM